MKPFIGVVFLSACLFAQAPSVVQADKKGVPLDVLGLRVAAVEARTPVQIVRQPPHRVLLTPVAAPVDVSRGNELLARLNPGKTYYFEKDSTGEDKAGEASGEPAVGPVGKPGGMPPKVKWGIAAGIATGAGVGLKIGLTEPHPVSQR